MLKVLRYVEIGQRKYEAGEEITQEDIKSWLMSDVDVQRSLAEHIAKGKIERLSDSPAAAPAAAPAAVEVAHEPAPEAHPAEPVHQESEPSPVHAG